MPDEYGIYTVVYSNTVSLLACSVQYASIASSLRDTTDNADYPLLIVVFFLAMSVDSTTLAAKTELREWLQ